MDEVKVTIKDAAIPPAAVSDDVVVIDSKGRRLKIKAPDLLFESRIVRMMGDAATNPAYMYGYVMPTVNVIAIDGDAINFPTSVLQVEAIMTRLGQDGLSAVLAHFTKIAKDSADRAAAEDQLKN